jgi:hypothetical protein
MKYMLFATLIILTVLVVIPPLRYQYVYSTGGDDTAWHLIYFNDMNYNTAYVPGHPLYLGQYLAGKLVNSLPFNPVSSFNVFHFVILVLSIWVIGITMWLSVSPLAGVLSSLILFGKTYLLELFHWGQIFDIVNIAIILPLALLCLHNMNKNIAWKVCAVFGLVLFASFHVNGLYILALMPIILGYEILTVYLSKKYKYRESKMKSYKVIAYSGLLCLGLVAMYTLGVSEEPMRLMMDASILFAIFIGGLFGKYLHKRSWIIAGAVVALAVTVAVQPLKEWQQNNSAIKNADKEAIAYLNSLSGQTYSTSSTINEHVYSLFVNKKYSKSLGDYLVDRSTPETPQSDSRSPYYINEDKENIVNNAVSSGYKPLKTFDSGEIDNTLAIPIIITVYGK